ncbi:hypothetical protein L226DRAFT_470624 [Lentinus tigrinus ALCF2SS1-7]|uniref:uncharacterized protein n=1 Tax=Lentinus tigrinus ALCF2SS1-7 TaxID=1328758 RepID=UPI001165DB7E|nr:hypothetical protein L226DRAFT_470624 [Lentinus tigrinus ALCF2SS1-7]
MIDLNPYQGTRRKMILSIDVGTTFSGMSYAFLDPGEVPKIEAVKRYPGQEDNAGHYRVPSVLYYHADGSVHFVGAKAMSNDVVMDPDYDELTLSRWFKLHLRPDKCKIAEMNEQNIPPLPTGKTVVQVFADFLRYMFKCAEDYITEHDPIMKLRWNSLKDTIELILTHPNGWEGLQESKMLEAAIMAGLVPDTPAGRDRVHFVTEGEAGLHYCVQNCFDSKGITPGEPIMVVDAGGGTVDISSYVSKSTAPLTVQETSFPKCVMLGSVTVNMRAENLFRARLQGSKYDDDATIRDMVDDAFDKKVKPLFSNEPKRAYYFPTGTKDNNRALNILRGSLTVTHDDMLSLFRPSLDGIVAAIKEQLKDTNTRKMPVYLIGGFSANMWLYTNLTVALRQLGLSLYRPDSHASKAVADGAIMYYLKGDMVAYRIGAEYTLGTDVSVNFDPSNPEHVARKNSIQLGPNGLMLDNGFSTILKKGTLVRHNQEFSETYCVRYNPMKEKHIITSDIIQYAGNKADPPSFVKPGSGSPFYFYAYVYPSHASR